jgi:tetratricopeptide (TPR) repeat protein
VRKSVCAIIKRFGGVVLACAMVISFAMTAGGCAANEGPTEKPTQKRAQSQTAIRAHKKTNAPDPFDAGAGRPPTAATMYSLSRILAAQEKTADCIALLKNLIQRYPNYAPAYNALAEAYLSLDRTDDAIRSLNEGVRRFPKDPVLQNNLGMIHFLDEDYEIALTHFERATDAAPGEANYRANKAAALGMLGRTAEAAELYRKHLKQSDVHENVNVLMEARRASSRRAGATVSASMAPTTAPAAADAPH